MIEYYDPNEKEYDILSGCMGYAIGAILGIIVCLCLGSCKSHYSVVETITKHDTLKVVNIQHDSVRVHDSVYVDRWWQGDTCYITKYKEHTAYKDRWRTDTIYKVKTDSVSSVKTIPVEKKLSWWYRLQMCLGDITILILVGVISYCIYKLIRLRKNGN